MADLQHLREGNLIGVRSENLYRYFLILSKPAFFGCQWAHAFYKTSSELLTQSEVLKEREGFRALIDFIEERRTDSIVKIAKGIDVAPFFPESKLKARIDTFGGGHEWYIYSPNFEILKKQQRLMPWQKTYPIASGMKCRDSFKLIAKKWNVAQIVNEEGSGQFPF